MKGVLLFMLVRGNDESKRVTEESCFRTWVEPGILDNDPTVSVEGLRNTKSLDTGKGLYLWREEVQELVHRRKDLNIVNISKVIIIITPVIPSTTTRLTTE